MKSTAGARNNDLSGDALLRELFNKEFNKLKARHERAAQRSIVRNTTDKEFLTALSASRPACQGTVARDMTQGIQSCMALPQAL